MAKAKNQDKLREEGEHQKHEAALKMYNRGWEVYKRVIGCPDEKHCSICKENEEQGWIPLNENFKSGHLHPPFHDLCRCGCATRVGEKRGKSGLPEDRWLVQREGDTVTVKPNSKYQNQNTETKAPGLFKKFKNYLH